MFLRNKLQINSTFNFFFMNVGLSSLNKLQGIVLDTYDEIKYISFLIFKTSLQQDTFSNMLKIVKIMMQKTLITMGLFPFLQYFQNLLIELCTIEFINT